MWQISQKNTRKIIQPDYFHDILAEADEIVRSLASGDSQRKKTNGRPWFSWEKLFKGVSRLMAPVFLRSWTRYYRSGGSKQLDVKLLAARFEKPRASESSVNALIWAPVTEKVVKRSENSRTCSVYKIGKLRWAQIRMALIFFQAR